MAEKEERYISITQMVAKENIETEKYRVMPRQEAIRKMCDAYFKAKDKGLMESERVVAALNALLEETK